MIREWGSWLRVRRGQVRNAANGSETREMEDGVRKVEKITIRIFKLLICSKIVMLYVKIGRSLVIMRDIRVI